MFGSFTDDDLDLPENLEFKDKEIVDLSFETVKELPEKEMYVITSKVLSGDHEGKKMNVIIQNRDNPMARENMVKFMLAFWSRDALKSGDYSADQLIGRRASMSVRLSEKDGKTYQNFNNWKDLGSNESEDGVNFG